MRAQAHGRGIDDLDGQDEVVVGIVIMRYGENALEVIDAVKQRLEDVRAGLPKDCELVVTYDRSELIRSAIGTLSVSRRDRNLVNRLLIVVEAIGGRVVSRAGDGRARYDITLRYAESFDNDPQRLGEALVKTPTGDHVPLSEVADVRFTTGAATIHSEGGKLVMYVFVDTDRPIVDYVEQAKQVVHDQVTLPTGVRIDWAGQFRNFERARQKLELVLPITLVIIVLLLYWNTRSWVETGIVILAVPFSLVGAVWLLWLLGYHLSVAVWIGMIALAGLDAETGVVMLLYLRLSHDARQRTGQLRTCAELDEAIVEGAAKRIRPKVMTVMTMLIGLLPVLWSSGTGADVMRRIAAPMVGGLVSSFILELIVYPAIYAVWKRRGLRARAELFQRL